MRGGGVGRGCVGEGERGGARKIEGDTERERGGGGGRQGSVTQ